MDTRTCNRCRQSLPATAEVFLRDRTRPLGLAYECRSCHRTRRKGRDRRSERWANLTPEQRTAKVARNRRYGRTPAGRAALLRKAYERIDACDLTTDEVRALVEQPCIYCGTTEENRGLDRIDNGRAHVRGNVQPCCTSCNIMRGDRFTVEEMHLLGKVVAEIRERRRHG